MSLFFEWDENKANSNLKKHEVTFEEASTVFRDIVSLTIPDPIQAGFEERLIIVGESYRQRLLVVVHVERGDNIRIISARRANKRERSSYEEGI